VPQTIMVGQSAMIPVTASGDHGATLAPSLSVSVTENGASVPSSGSITNGAGTITAGPFATPGSHTLKIATPGTSQWSAANTTVVVHVLDPTTTGLSMKFSSSTHHPTTSVTLTATVKPKTVLKTVLSGTVTFLVDGTPVGSMTVTGTAKTVTAKLALPGGLGVSCTGAWTSCIDTVTAVYSGDTTYATSTGTKAVTIKHP
jgi:hypothetical protein